VLLCFGFAFRYEVCDLILHKAVERLGLLRHQLGFCCDSYVIHIPLVIKTANTLALLKLIKLSLESGSRFPSVSLFSQVQVKETFPFNACPAFYIFVNFLL